MVSFIGSAILSGVGEGASQIVDAQLKKELEESKITKAAEAQTARDVRQAQVDSDAAQRSHKDQMTRTREASRQTQLELIATEERAEVLARNERIRVAELLEARIGTEANVATDLAAANINKLEREQKLLAEREIALSKQNTAGKLMEARQERLAKSFETKDLPPIERIGPSPSIFEVDPSSGKAARTETTGDLIKDTPGKDFGTKTGPERRVEEADFTLSSLVEKNWGTTEQEHIDNFNILPEELQQRISKALLYKFNAVKEELLKVEKLPEGVIARVLPKQVGFSDVEASIMNGIVLERLETSDPERRSHQKETATRAGSKVFRDTVQAQFGPMNMDPVELEKRKKLYKNPNFALLLNPSTPKEKTLSIVNNPELFPELGVSADEPENLITELEPYLTPAQPFIVPIGSGIRTRVSPIHPEIKTKGGEKTNRQENTARQVGATVLRGARSLANPGTITSRAVSSLSGYIGDIRTWYDDALQTFGVTKNQTGKAVTDKIKFLEDELKAANPDAAFNRLEKQLESLTNNPEMITGHKDGDQRREALVEALGGVEAARKKYKEAQEKLKDGGLTDDERMNVITTQLFDIQRTALTFQLASLLQGGASGNSVSTADFERVFESLWGTVGQTEEDKKTALFTSFASAYVIQEQILSESAGNDQNIVSYGGKSYNTTHPVVRLHAANSVKVLQDLLSEGTKESLVEFYRLIGVTIPPKVIGLAQAGDSEEIIEQLRSATGSSRSVPAVTPVTPVTSFPSTPL
tara:strand:+ start:1327 stop:3600 length:2274 start_codon:yes stop_codon:yes gene_type:complete